MMRQLGKSSTLVTAAAFCAAMLFAVSNSHVSAEENETTGSDRMGNDIPTIEAFVDAFNERDVDKVMTFFVDEDPVYHNMPGPPVKGTDAVRNLINMFVSSADSLDWEILHIAQTGDTVLAERIDRFVIKGKDVALPCLGAFDMKDGKIAEWRDYFDMATWTRQTAE